MPDYIYLLENRLSADQQHALRQLREVAREAGLILFLTADAVRDLTSGHAVRDIEVAVHGNVLKLKKAVEKAGAMIWGVDEASRALYLAFPGTVRIDLLSTHRAEYPKPGKPVFHPASIQEDLRRRDFTVNAMAISLNEGSYGLLMDPLNGVADIEARTLRLVSNYGFLEEPAFLIRATRYRARLGWDMDPRTQARYDNAREENVIEHLSAHERSRELEQIGHEDDGLKVLRALETEGWMKALFPAWVSAKAEEEKLNALHDLAVELILQGVHADMSAAQMELLTAKMQGKDVSALKKLLLRPGFVQEWNSLDSIAAGFSKVLLAKDKQTPSSLFKLFTSYDPEAVLWLGFTSNNSAVKERYNQFLKVWPETKQRIPHLLLQEMRITPDLPVYLEVLHKIFLELIDGRLTTPEEMRAFLEPYSPPAPPPPVTIKRSRARRSAEARMKERAFEDEEEGAEEAGEEEDLEEVGGVEEELDLSGLPKGDLEADLGEEVEEAEDEEEAEAEEEEEQEPAVKRGKKESAHATARKETAAPSTSTKTAKQAPKEEKTPVRPEPRPAVKPAATKPAAPAAKTTMPPAKSKPAPEPAKKIPGGAAAKTGKTSPAPKATPKKIPAKMPAKAPVKPPAKSPVKAKVVAKPAKHAPAAKKASAKPAKPSKPGPKAAKKR